MLIEALKVAAHLSDPLSRQCVLRGCRMFFIHGEQPVTDLFQLELMGNN